MKILITGSMGYVGSVLGRHLRQIYPDAELIGYDQGFSGHCPTNATLLPEVALDRQVFGDVRELPAVLLAGADAVLHLAAVSNDPMGNQSEAVTINAEASVRIACMAATAGVRNFVFASSCSMYGYAEGGLRKETDATNPLTAYARSKIGTEEALCSAHFGDMMITCMRFATPCGMSDRLRLDLVLNDFVACAVTSGEITVLCGGSPWRPLIDVADMGRAIEWAIERPASSGGKLLSVNAGSDVRNYQVRDLATAIANAIPGTKVSINTDAPPDKRSYKVDFTLFSNLPSKHGPQVKLEGRSHVCMTGSSAWASPKRTSATRSTCA